MLGQEVAAACCEADDANGISAGNPATTGSDSQCYAVDAGAFGFVRDFWACEAGEPTLAEVCIPEGACQHAIWRARRRCARLGWVWFALDLFGLVGWEGQ